MMIEYLPSFFLLCLVLSVVFLIRLLLEMPESIDEKTDYLTTELKDISVTLNDIADLFNDALGAINNSPVAQTPSSPMEAILSGLISSVMSPNSHGSTQEPEIGEVYEIHPSPPQTENELD